MSWDNEAKQQPDSKTSDSNQHLSGWEMTYWDCVLIMFTDIVVLL